MSRPALWKISVRTSVEAADAVSELLQERFSHPASTYIDADTGATAVSVFLPEKPAGISAALHDGLSRLRRLGLDIAPGVISLRKLRRENWAESWKRHFKPLEFGARLLVKPSWSRRRAKRGQARVVLDPGLSFGTGRHPTTAFCLRQLVRRRAPGKSQSLLDVGTGSGILAICAVKLGYAPVDAFDLDPEAVRAARANARRNRVHRRLRLLETGLARFRAPAGRSYDIVCANLVSTLLIQERDRLVRHLKPGGVLVLAGILKPEFEEVAAVYAQAGLRLATSRAEKDWRSGTFASDG